MKFALVGNQNCGKTTLFNQLTGLNQHVGNFPGVTVDKKSGQIRGYEDCEIVDLPGIYSLRPYSSEEIVTRDFILFQKPDVIINILDATNLERNLYLTIQLIEMHVPMVVALNMMDEVYVSGGSIDTKLLSAGLGVSVVPISAVKNEGINELVDIALETAQRHNLPSIYDFCSPGPIRRCIYAVTDIVEKCAKNNSMFSRYAAMNIIEGNMDIIEMLSLDYNELEMCEYNINEMERERKLDRHAAIADMRYNYIEKICSQAVRNGFKNSNNTRSRKIDNILTHRLFAIPIFIFIMCLIFYLTFDVVGKCFSNILKTAINSSIEVIDSVLTVYDINAVVHSLIIDGIFAGIGNVLGFLPIIVVLFFFLSMLEDTGYMARIAFVMDKPLRRIGLSGKSIVPMILGFGCTVPAVMATRTLASNRDRKMTVFLIPFMSCSAKIPVYAFFTTSFFPNYRAAVMLFLYLFGIFIGIIYAIISKNLVFTDNPSPFVMELPNYRLPTLKSTGRLMLDKAYDFVKRALTIIFAASVIIWFMKSFNYRFDIVADSSRSLLASIGRLTAPLFKPLGFCDWRISTSLIAGFMAKEAIVGTLSVLLKDTSILNTLNWASALSFLVFTLLYTPCVAAAAAIRRELGSSVKAVLIILLQCLIAWICSALVFRTAMLFV